MVQATSLREFTGIRGWFFPPGFLDNPFSPIKKVNLKTDFSYFLLFLSHPSSTFPEFPDPPILSLLLILLWVSGALPVLVEKWNGWCTPALCPILMGRCLVFCSSSENISTFLFWAVWKLLQGTKLLQVGECGSSFGILSNGVCENIVTSSWTSYWLASLWERTPPLCFLWWEY